MVTHNGTLAEEAIADRHRALDLDVETQVHFDQDFNRVPSPTANTAGHRIVDVEVKHPHPLDPHLGRVEHFESKATRISKGDISASQLAHDSGILSQNRAMRNAGFALEGAGKVARPVGMVVDTVEVVGAIRRDGGIGVETGKTVTGITGGAAGSWGGATAGVAIGTAVLPGAGTVVGGVIGGICGAIVGEGIAKSAFVKVKGWFS